MSAGTARLVELSGDPGAIAEQLAGHLAQLTSHQAIILAPPPEGRGVWSIVRKEDARREAGTIARTRDFFKRPEGPGLIALDFDGKTFPTDVLGRLVDARGVSGVLATVFPAFAAAARVSRASVSVGIRNKESGAETDSNSGRHHYYIASDASDAPRFGEVLRDRLTLAGWGWGELSKSGAVLVRTLIDAAVTIDGARLVYEADAILADERLEHVAGARTPDHREGGLLDTRALPDLTPQETAELDQIKAGIRASLQEESAAARAAWIQDRGNELVARGVAAPAAQQALAVACGSRELTGDFPIHLDNGDVVSVRDILAAPAKYHKATCADPLEPDYGGGRDKAIIYTDGPRPHIYSHAHGGIDYALRADPESFFAAGADDGSGAWPEPVDLFGDGDASALMDVPAAALPPCIEGYARDEAERMGAPVAFLAASAIAVASAAVGGQVRIQPKAQDTRWTVPPFLWVALIEAPGGKKTPVISSATASLVGVDSRWAAADLPRRQAWEIEARKRKKDAPTPRPRVRRAAVDSFTVESVRDVLVDNPRGVLVSADELSGLIGGLDQYKAAGGSDRADLLKLMDGGPRSFDRVGRSYRVECWGAAVLGGIQPKRLAEISRSLDPDGLLQRFLPIVGDSERRRGVDRPPNAAAVAEYEAAIRGLAEADTGGGFFDGVSIVTLSDGAQAIRRRFEDRVSALQDMPQMSDAWRGHLAKWDGFFARLLLVFHMLENWPAGVRKAAAIPVSEATAQRADRFAGFLLSHAMRFYESVVGIGAGGEAARQAAGIVLVLNSSTVTRRMMYEKHRAWRPEGDASRELLEAMRILARLGWCNPADRDDNGPTSWSINPKVFERFSDRAAAEAERRRKAYDRVQAAVAERRRVREGVSAPIAPCEAAGVFA